MERVFHFSGGKSSAKMVIDNYQNGDLVIFCDTGREHPKTYKFINDFEAFEGIPVIRVFSDWKRMLFKMRGIPNRAKRRCTIELKIKAARRYLRANGIISYIQFIGFRYDELERVKKYKPFWKNVETKFPLFDCKIDKQNINDFWNSKDYNLEIPSILGNCDLCFQKGESSIIAILTNDIKLADKWIEDEEDHVNNPNGYSYINGLFMRDLKNMAQNLINKGKVYNLNDFIPKFNCSCTS